MAEEGESYQGGGAVTQQPRSKKRELEDFVRDLDPLQVQGKNSKHVQERTRVRPFGGRYFECMCCK